MTDKNRGWLDELPGMDPRRRRTLPAAAVVVSRILQALDVTELMTSGRSLRDGLVQDWILLNDAVAAPRYGLVGPRERSVLSVMERYNVDVAHAEQVTRFATALFDETQAMHGLDPEDRQLLQHAARLHDLGHHISGEDHNLHGEYLIRHTPMFGFTAPEIGILGQLVRYHRGPLPKRKHAFYGTLPKPDRRRLRLLAGFLRLADALDRSHHQPISEVTAALDDDILLVRAVAGAPAHVERWAAERRRTLLSDALDCEVLVEVVSPPMTATSVPPQASVLRYSAGTGGAGVAGTRE
jgi:exopolyphosphatase/guanosine-5'-triphosphate,3'-diphosphate pyrophosphatase